MKFLLAACAMLAAPAAFAQDTTTYSYDALGRLRTSSTTGGPNNNTTSQIDFDKAGNRSNYQITGASGAARSGVKVVVVPLNGFTIIPIPNPWAAK